MEDIVLFKEQQQLLMLSDIKLTDADLAGEETVLAEVQLSPASTLEGMSLAEIDFRRRFGAFVLALARTGESMREKLSRIALKRWDTLLLFGSRRSLEQLYQLDDFLPLQEVDLRIRLHPRWWLHAAALVGVVVAATFVDVPIARRRAGRHGRAARQPHGQDPARLPPAQLVGLLPARGDHPARRGDREERAGRSGSAAGSRIAAAARAPGSRSRCSTSRPWC